MESCKKCLIYQLIFLQIDNLVLFSVKHMDFICCWENDQMEKFFSFKTQERVVFIIILR